MKKLIACILAIILLTGCELVDVARLKELEEDNERLRKELAVLKEEETGKPNRNTLPKIKELYGQGESKDIYAIETIKVGKGGHLKPGIYDLSATTGTGNVIVKRKLFKQLETNYVLKAQNIKPPRFPSKTRVILFEGDSLEFMNVNKVHFEAVPKDVTKKTELSMGEWIVGRDIEPGKYKLETNGAFNKEYPSLGWTIDQYSDDEEYKKYISFNLEENDVAVNLKPGDVLMIEWIFGSVGDEPAEEDVLKFVPLEEQTN
ncbi:hypothetical protein [Guggenheimella bovis]